MQNWRKTEDARIDAHATAALAEIKKMHYYALTDMYSKVKWLKRSDGQRRRYGKGA